MNDFLLVLFYQAIVAVNTAVILSGIIWLAKRKDEKDGRKPNPDFTPPPEKKPPAPPTTGTSAIEPKKRKYDEYSALPYAVGTVQRFYKILTCAIVQAENGKIIIPPEEAGTPVSVYGEGKIYGYVQTLLPDDGNDDGKAYSINPRTGEVEGYPAIDGTIYRVYFWTSGKAAKTVHTSPYSGPDKIEALEEAPLTFFNPAEESVKRYEHDCIDAKCADCWFCVSSLGGGNYCALRKEPVNLHERRRCHYFKRYEAPSLTTHICKNCKHYLATEEGEATGLCGMMEEIVFGNSCRACFEKREGKDHE